MGKPADDNRREAVCAWLTANGINPSDVPNDSDLAITTEPDGQYIHYEAFDRDINGMILASWSGEGPARSRRTAPMRTPPPVWWEPRVKPTRDQLLEALGRVQQLAERWKYTADRKNGPRQELLQALGEHAAPDSP